MTRLAVIALCLSLAACGSFKLAGPGSKAPPEKTQEQMQLDVLTCKDRAATESQTAADTARGFALGVTLSVIGVAIDYEQQKVDQRRIFKSCMNARGYTITAATD